MDRKISVFVLSSNRLLRESIERMVRKKPDLDLIGAQSIRADSKEEVINSDAEVLVLDSLQFVLETDGWWVTASPAERRRIKVLLIAMDDDKKHFLSAVNYSNQVKTTLVPVTNKDNRFLGVVTATDLLRAAGGFAGADESGGVLVLEMKRVQFAISEISRIVESNDATILHLNTTAHPETGMLIVTLHINKREISAIISTFERYQYDVVYYYGDEQHHSDIEYNLRNLMNYLHI